MATPTSNYGFLKPGSSETYDVNTLDNNYDMIDSAIYNNLHRPPAADASIAFSNGGFAWSAGQSWDAGTLSLDTSTNSSTQVSSPSPSFATPGTLSGSIKFTQPGIYDVRWYIGPSADPGSSGYKINASTNFNNIGGGWDRFASVSKSSSPYNDCVVEATGIRVPVANCEIRLQGNQANATTNFALVVVQQRAKF